MNYLNELTSILDDLRESLLLSAHPVGSVYITENKDPDPSELFGGKWECVQNTKVNIGGYSYYMWKRIS